MKPQQTAEEAPNTIFQKLYLDHRTEVIEQHQILSIIESQKETVTKEIKARCTVDKDLGISIRDAKLLRRSVLREINDQYNDIDYQKILKDTDNADEITIELENELARLENLITTLECQREVNHKICQALKMKKKVLLMKIYNAKRIIKEASKVKTALSHDFISRSRYR